MRPLVKYLYTFLLPLLLLAATYGLAQGQTGGLTINTTSPSTLTACGDADLFFINLSNTAAGTLTNIQVGVGLPVGIQYVSGSIAGSGLGNVNVSTPDSIHFDARDLAPGQGVSYFFAARANCDFFLNPDSIFANLVHVTSANGDDTTVLSAPYNIAFASLSITSITVDSTSLGKSITRCVTLTNGGQGFLKEFQFTEFSDPNSLTVSNFRIMPGNIPLTPTQNGDTNLIVFDNNLIMNMGDGDARFERNESVQICYDVQVNECFDLTSELGAYWGCDNNICQDDQALGQVKISGAVPNLTFRQSYTPTTCYGGPDAAIGKIIVTNNGNGRARDVLIDVAQSNGPSFAAPANYYSGFDPNTIVWKNSNGTVTAITPSNSWNGTQNCLPANSKTRFQVLIPWIEPGEQDTLVFYQYTCCSQTCGNNRGLTTQFKYDYFDECKSNSYAGGPTNLNYYWASEDDIVEMYQTGPSDIYPGNTYTYTITQSRWRFVNPKAPGAYYQIQFELPPGIGFSGNAADVELRNQFGALYTPTSFSYVGNIVTVNYPLGFQYGPEKAEASIKVTADCTGRPGGSFDTRIKYSVLVVPDPGCSCTLCANSLSFDVTVHCPPAPCPNGGMVSLGYENNRLNYGSNDAPEDGLPDPGVPNTAVMRDNFLMFGDTMYTKMTGVVETSGANPNWQYGSLESIVNRGAWLDVLVDSIRVVDASTNTVYACALPLPTVSTISNVRTFDYDIAVANLAGCVPANFRYEAGDTVEVIAYYRSRRTGGVVETTDILNIYSMSDAPNGNIYACDTFSGNFTYVGYYYSVCCGPNYHTTNNCNPVTSSESYYLSIGNCCTNYSGGNLFKNEYRYWAKPSVLRAIPPTGYSYNSANFYYRRTRGSAANSQYSAAITPLNPTADTLVFLLEGLFEDNGGTFPLSDDGFNGWWTIQWQPSCNVTPNVWQPVFYELDYNVIDQLKLAGAAGTTLRRRDSLKYDAPRLQVVANPQTINGASSTATWNIELANNSNASNGNNAWIAVEPYGSNITITSVQDVATGNTINPVGGVYQLGNIPTSSGKQYRVLANYTSCNLDSVRVYYGWDCSGYPQSLATSACTPLEYTLYLQPKDAAVQATLTSSTTPVDICNLVPVELEITSSQIGSVNDINALVALPVSGGITYEPGSVQIEYPAGSGFVSTVDPTAFGFNGWLFDLSSMNANLQANGLPGVQQSNQNSVIIRFDLRTDCDYLSGGNFTVNINGKKPCGVSITPVTVVAPPIKINGVTGQYSTEIEMSIDTIKGCQQGKPMRVNIQNMGPNATEPTDSLIIQLPDGLAFDGNLTGIINGLPNPVPDVVNLPMGVTKLRWLMPGGVALLDSIVFDIGVMSTFPGACKNYTIKSTALISRSLYCSSTGSNCLTAAVAGTGSTKVDVKKPILTLTNVSSTYTVLPNGDYEVIFSGTIGNTGLPIPAGDTTRLLFYCDADQSATLSPGDTTFGSYTTLQAIDGNTVSFTDTFIAPSGACMINCNRTFMAVVSPTAISRQCNCDKLLRSVSPVFVAEATGDTTICPGATTSLSAQGGSTYTWSPAASLSTPAANTTLATPTATTEYIVTVNDGNGCLGTDTVEVVHFTEPTAAFSFDFSCQDHVRNFTDNTQNGSGTVNDWAWDFGDTGNSQQQNPGHTYAGPASYNVRLAVMDDNGCVDTLTRVLVEPALLTLDSLDQVDVSCYGGSDGSLLIGGVGGTLPYTYQVDGGAGQLGGNFVGLTEGEHTVSVTDSNSCVAMDTLIISQPDSISISGVVEDEKCGRADGGVTITVIGGTLPYGYSWSDNTTNQDLANASAGDYTLQVSDANGCMTTETFTVANIERPVVEALVTEVTCFGDSDGVIELLINGTTDPYTIGWVGSASTSTMLDNLVGGDYTYTVTDIHGCEVVETINVFEPPLTTVDAGMGDTIILGLTGRLNASAQQMTNVASVSWTPAETVHCDDCLDPIVQPLENTVYTVTITDLWGCEYSDSVMVYINTVEHVGYIPNAFTPNGDGVNDEFFIHAKAVLAFHLQVFDRWGEMVFETRDINEAWNGEHKGELARPGVYVYQATLTYLDRQQYKHSGSITLIR